MKELTMRSNVVDMAIGIIISGTFGKNITALVSDVIITPIGIMFDGVIFCKMKIIILHAVKETEKAEVAISFGLINQKLIYFALIAFCFYIVIK